MQIVSIKNLFSGKYKKNISKCRLLKQLPIELSINLFIKPHDEKSCLWSYNQVSK